ncbi:Lactosylceramide 4-alpha-galactosyltransferase [Eumeta japonica]|uniref:Lactosylceramide 4-alpha-galactosyltransferase n=1 Tax=Eumeta variegata TaxID=151549 RepID=A0A4C1UXU3_EUMVA|nr:Lactosylceramide 4-alpha-galactosyltransferase [Eumeta japonica]
MVILYDPLDDISCHHVHEGDVLPAAENLEPSRQSIFFVESSCRRDLNPRQACAVESAARAHPNWTVHLLFLSPISDVTILRGPLKELKLFDNISLVRVHLLNLTKGTVVEKLVHSGHFKKSRWPISHIADAVRYLTLYKWGGIYLDLDVVVTRALDPLARNWGAKESAHAVAAGALSFSRDAIGRRVANETLNELANTFRGDVWGQNGPGVISRVIQKLCRRPVYNISEGSSCEGSQISLINSRLIKVKEKKDNVNIAYMKTVNGVKKTDGLITIKVKIFDLEEEVDVHIVENEDFDDFIIGLDMIKKFKLTQNEDLQIEQKKITNKMDRMSKDSINEEKNIKTFAINFNEYLETEEFVSLTDHLDNEKKTEIEKIINEYKTIFAKDKYDIGSVRDYEAHIDLQVNRYCSKRPYRCTIEDRLEIEEQIAMLLRNNLIEESYSPFAAPVTLAFKKGENRKSRLCVDFRELNKIVVPQAQPFPLIDDLITKTRNCMYFTTLDINSAFWAIPLRVEDRKKDRICHARWPFSVDLSPFRLENITSNFPENSKQYSKKAQPYRIRHKLY